jgi:hypothetical protein
MEGTIMSIIEDIQRRSAHIHWPQGIVPEQADLFAHNDIVIVAPPGKIWEHLIHATAWPDWYSNASDVAVNASSGLLGAGVTFDWITFGAHIYSTVHEFEPTARIGWYGETDQWLAYHTWLLEPRDEGTTYVVMEETGSGLNPKKLAGSNPGHVHRGHDPVEHQPQVPLRKHPGLAATERQHPQLAGSRPARPNGAGPAWAAPTAAPGGPARPGNPKTLPRLLAARIWQATALLPASHHQEPAVVPVSSI